MGLFLISRPQSSVLPIKKVANSICLSVVRISKLCWLYPEVFFPCGAAWLVALYHCFVVLGGLSAYTPAVCQIWQSVPLSTEPSLKQFLLTILRDPLPSSWNNLFQSKAQHVCPTSCSPCFITIGKGLHLILAKSKSKLELRNWPPEIAFLSVIFLLWEFCYPYFIKHLCLMLLLFSYFCAYLQVFFTFINDY